MNFFSFFKVKVWFQNRRTKHKRVRSDDDDGNEDDLDDEEEEEEEEEEDEENEDRDNGLKEQGHQENQNGSMIDSPFSHHRKNMSQQQQEQFNQAVAFLGLSMQHQSGNVNDFNSFKFNENLDDNEVNTGLKRASNPVNNGNKSLHSQFNSENINNNKKRRVESELEKSAGKEDGLAIKREPKIGQNHSQKYDLNGSNNTMSPYNSFPNTQHLNMNNPSNNTATAQMMIYENLMKKNAAALAAAVAYSNPTPTFN